MNRPLRRILILLGGVCLLGAGAIAARQLAVGRVEGAMAGAGLSWEARTDRVGSARWAGIRAQGLRAEAVDLQLLPRSELRIEGATLDLSDPSAWIRRLSSAQSIAPSTGASLPVRVDALSVVYRDHPLIQDLSGSLSPVLDLNAAAGHIRSTDDHGVIAQIQRDWDLGLVAGQATATLTVRAGTATVDLDMPQAVVSHPMLASKPLPPHPLHAHATWTIDTGALDARLSLGPAVVNLAGTVSLAPLSWDLAIDLPDLPLEDVLALFGSLVPEASGAQVVGTIGLSGTLAGPEPRWELHPRADGLGVEGALPPIDSLKEGPLTWRAPAAGGQWLARTTGEGQPGWVPLDRAGLMPAAVIAAEDSGFWTHPGYDMAQVADAMTAQRLDRMRGGSTITQQLVKNLFLNGERTVARKLRELIMAVELDRKLGKRRVLGLYLNVVELGPEIYGIGPAADTYFLKRPERLTVREAAFLAAILPAPRTAYERAYIGGRVPDARVNAIIDNMVDGGALSPEQGARAKRDQLRFVPPAR